MTSIRGRSIEVRGPRTIVFVGTRPEAIKLAPLVRALMRCGAEAYVINVAQHRDLTGPLLRYFRIEPYCELDVMTERQRLSELSARILQQVDPLLRQIKPDLAVVQGDTTTALASALASHHLRIPVAHVEAGLRSYDLEEPFPEESNRRAIAQLASIHFAPTEVERDNLLREGIDPSSIHITGNTGIDALHHELRRQETKQLDAHIDELLPSSCGPIALCGAHRREAFGEPHQEMCLAIADLARDFEHHNFIYTLDLNPDSRIAPRRHLQELPNVALLEPLDYPLFIRLLQRSQAILTDSGGLQEEAPELGKPLFLMRNSTERPQAVKAGVVRVVGRQRARIRDVVGQFLATPEAVEPVGLYGDGKASERIVRSLSVR